MKNINNVHVLKVKFLGATNYTGSRIKITSERFRDSKILSYDYKIGNVIEQAIEYLQMKGYSVLSKAGGKDCYYIVSETFKSLKDE